MNIETAMNNIIQVLRAYRGTAEDHENLKDSFELIKTYVNYGIEAQAFMNEKSKIDNDQR